MKVNRMSYRIGCLDNHICPYIRCRQLEYSRLVAVGGIAFVYLEERWVVPFYCHGCTSLYILLAYTGMLQVLATYNIPPYEISIVVLIYHL